MWLLYILLPVLIFAGPSARGKCALECYANCMRSGTPSGAYCNCPMERNSEKNCSSINRALSKAEFLPTVPNVNSDYLDSHTIRLSMPLHPGAFAYIFEYSLISTHPEDWYFAGASTNATVTFSVLDSCRDYQFRVIAVIRSTNPEDIFLLYHPRAIPVKLPPFVLSEEKVTLEAPTVNTSAETLKVYVKWTLPKGYTDSDIYGYEAPALYPIQCRTPEDELPQPRVEIVKNGGRLAVALPASVLEARCRLWVEVRMLPRCIRLEPFSIQKNIEIDCEKNPELEICSKDANPKCLDVIDVYGSKGRAKVAWEAPNGKKPIYYHMRYGPAQMKGIAPFISWQIATKRDVKIDGSVTSVPLDITEDKDYGVQICAIMTEQRKRPKFGVVKVVPFQCTSCKQKSSVSSGRCGECGRIEGNPVSDQSWAKMSRPQPNKKKLNESTPTPTVLRMETDLIVASGTKSVGAADLSLLPLQAEDSVQQPLSLARAEEINKEASAPVLVDSAFSKMPQVVADSGDRITVVNNVLKVTKSARKEKEETTTMITTTTTDEPEEITTTTTEEPTTVVTVNEEPSTTYTEETTTMMLTTTTFGKIIEVDTSLVHNRQEPNMELTTTESMSIGKSEKEDFVLTGDPNNHKSLEDIFKEIQGPVKEEKMEKKDENQKQQSHEKEEKEVKSDETEEEIVSNEDQEKPNQEDYSDKEVIDSVNRKQVHGTKTLSVKAVSTPVKSSMKCLLANGIVCEFGCLTRYLCVCNLSTHQSVENGGCVLKTPNHIQCLPKRDINATWDPLTMNIMVRSTEAGEHIRSMEGADKLFVEFGKVRPEMMTVRHLNATLGGIVFAETKRHKMIISTETLIRTGVFSQEPFIFHINDSLNIGNEEYGMRICTYNSTLMLDPYIHNWDDDTSVNRTGNIVQVVQLSAVHFTNEIRSGFFPSSYWTIFFAIGKVALMVVLVIIMGVLVYLNCSRIKALYDRKKTRYFRPYYIEPHVGSSGQRYPGNRFSLNRSTSYYNNRVI